MAGCGEATGFREGAWVEVQLRWLQPTWPLSPGDKPSHCPGLSVVVSAPFLLLGSAEGLSGHTLGTVHEVVGPSIPWGGPASPPVGKVGTHGEGWDPRPWSREGCSRTLSHWGCPLPPF